MSERRENYCPLTRDKTQIVGAKIRILCLLAAGFFLLSVVVKFEVYFIPIAIGTKINRLIFVACCPDIGGCHEYLFLKI
jgi:hypothetical protein